MAIPADVTNFYTPEEYLALEREAPYKSEYLDGEIIAMSGGSESHSLLKVALVRIFDVQLQGRPCKTYDSDMRVRVDARLYAYPDLSIVCGERLFATDKRDILLNPTVVAEVLSPSTETFDRGRKFRRYRRLLSLQQYVLVSQDTPYVEVFTREGDIWTFREYGGLDATVSLESIDCTLALRDLYARVEFEPETEEAGRESQDETLPIP